MSRQKRNLSVFRKYQEHIASISNEENEISDCSDSENEENRSSRNLTGNCTNLNLSTVMKTSRRNSCSTPPPAKRLKRTPLSMVRNKPLHIERSKRKSFHSSTALFNDLNLSSSNLNEKTATENCPNLQDEEESQELTIEWSSPDECDDAVAQEQIFHGTQLTQPEGCSQKSTQKKNLYKRCRKGGYLHQLQQTMKQSKTDRKFLEHDKKFGLRQYIELRVLKVENSFGVHLATVSSPSNEICHVVLSAEMAEHVKIDSILESFVENITPYEVECYDAIKKVIAQPGKFMLS